MAPAAVTSGHSGWFVLFVEGLEQADALTKSPECQHAVYTLNLSTYSSRGVLRSAYM